MKNRRKNQISDSMFSKGKTYVFPLETKWKKRKWKLRKKLRLKDRRIIKSQIQCFLKEKHMFDHETEQKYANMKVKKNQN